MSQPDFRAHIEDVDQLIVGELVIEQQEPERRGIFKKRSQPARWTAHRNLWHIPEDQFPLHFEILKDNKVMAEYRFDGERLRVKAPHLQWMIEDSCVVPEEEYAHRVDLAEHVDLLQLAVFHDHVWVPADQPFYEVVSDPCTLSLLATHLSMTTGLRFEHNERARGEAFCLENLAEREFIHPDLIVCHQECDEEEVSEELPVVVGLGPNFISPLHPVAELVVARLSEVTEAKDRLETIVATRTSPASDIVAQLSVLSSAARRLLDDARTLNNDPDAR